MGDPIVTTGGSCANTIKGLASLGQRSALAGKMGRDPMGKLFLEKFEKYGVVPLIVYSDTPTAQVASLITPDHQRTFRCFPGAGNEFTEEDLIPELFQGVRLVHIEGYAFYNQSLAERSMQMAKEAGALVSLDLGSFELVKKFKGKLLELIPAYVDIIFANEDETRVLTGLGPEEGCDLLRQMCQATVILIGKDGCWIGSPDEKCLCPAIAANVIDTTGAGDLFASGFLHGFLEGCTLKECGRYGNLTGGTVVQYKGAEIPDHKWTELKEIMPKGQ